MRWQTLYEARWIFAAEAVLWVACLLFLPWAAVVVGLAILFTLSFFRDPERSVEGGPEVVVSPADGLVVAIEEIDEPEFLLAKQRRIAIFLSVFDVHVNRAPIAGEITHSHHRSGSFLDARDPACSQKNEARMWVFRGELATVAVRQITGAIARRIVAWSPVGEVVARGERFGMIRFGSRTELYLPLSAEVTVGVGDRVKGAETVLARLAGGG